ncbi:MAG TPA: DUF2017 family protein [Mycobacteriales bacterium]|nr:DUF2017 family protein [Mycobacteriales bacterium]
MARRFRRTRDGFDTRLDDLEAALLRDLAADLLTLLDLDPTEGDEVLGRLFPDGYADDPAAAADLRELIQDDLRDRKRAALRAISTSLADRDAKGRLTLDAETAEDWLTGLNDLRLALGTRLGVTEQMYDDPPDDDVDEASRHALEVYGWLGWLQEGLVDALLRSLPGSGAGAP